jgi:hypothetical protein
VALVATLALLVAAVPALAAQGANLSKACTDIGDTIYDSPLSHDGCTSAAASGDIRGAGYSARCKGLVAEFGGYPFVFEEPFGTFPVKNHGQCVNTLRYIHTNFG